MSWFWKTVLVLAMVAAGLWLQVSCGDEDPEVTDVDDDTGDDDTDNPNAGLYSETCDINYGIDMGCDAELPSCRHAYLINEDRYNHPEESDCAPALEWDADVAAVARAHSQDMCDRGFFDHVNPDGQDPFDRMDDAGVDWVAAGENIFMACGYTMTDAIAAAEEAFMDEPECQLNHRSNILNRNFKFVGVGVVPCDDGCIYLTQDYVSYSFSDVRSDPHEYCPNLE